MGKLGLLGQITIDLKINRQKIDKSAEKFLNSGWSRLAKLVAKKESFFSPLSQTHLPNDMQDDSICSTWRDKASPTS